MLNILAKWISLKGLLAFQQWNNWAVIALQSFFFITITGWCNSVRTADCHCVLKSLLIEGSPLMSSTNWPLYSLYFCLVFSPSSLSACLSLSLFFPCFSVPVLSEFIQLLSCREICEINTNAGLGCSWGDTITRLFFCKVLGPQQGDQ